jgi:hypothetical protein
MRYARDWLQMIRLTIYSVNFSNYIDLTDTEQESSNGRPVIRFDVSPNEDDYIELETGEIFGSGGKERNRDADLIGCQVALFVSNEQQEPLFIYGGGISGDDPLYSYLQINIPLSPTKLDFIIKNIQSGIFPVTMSIDWKTNYFSIDDGEGGRKEPENIIGFGWEPDGSHQI